MPVTQQRTNEYLREALVYLAQYESRERQQVIAHLAEVMHPSVEELERDKDERVAWELRFLWTSVRLVKAGWMTKNGRGVWAATPEGRVALEQYPDPKSFRAAVDEAYANWKKSSEPPQRRGWLVRGSSVMGVDITPDWLAESYCSLPATHLSAPDEAVTTDQLEEMVKRDYGHLKYHEQKSKIEEIVSFVTRIKPDDLIITTSKSHVFVGDVTGDWSYLESENGRSNLRRPVEWRNADAPIDYNDLPAPLPARFKTGKDVVELTDDLRLIDELLDAQSGVDQTTPTNVAPRHEHLPSPSSGLAKKLFVDDAWLQEVRDLLDERRQLIFHGPPGTGKTWIARKLADDLVGPEQVKLVQFHPAYTYEDFFEGYRPAPGTGDGTINFELKAGPFRQLVNRAREHPDQAFVLIIDEINRANLAKVFGELYFLLEYRDQAVDLLYSSDDEGFTLPTNIYLIGTMNTADRSIALIDSAMRRRFAFVELSPGIEPTKSLLRKWSKDHGLGERAADLLDQLNSRIEDPEFRVGPAYFMKSVAADAHSDERLDRIWRTSILPLLQEHHYGEWEAVEKRYRLASLLPSDTEKKAGAEPAPADAEIPDVADAEPAETSEERH